MTALSNGLTAVISVFAVSSALAEPSHRTMVKFGDEVVELKFSNIPNDGRLQELWEATNEAPDAVEQERLLRIRWEDYGEVNALQSLAIHQLKRGDYVFGYAHLYAAHRISKWFEDTVTRPDYKGGPEGRYVPPGPLAEEGFVELEGYMNLVGEKLTASQRAQGVKLAAKLVRENPNCCLWP